MTDFNLTDGNFSFDLALPNRGTAPFNEIESMTDDDHGQRHENEATDTDNYLSNKKLKQNEHQQSTPKDFKWGKDGQGNPTLKPTNAAIKGLTSLATHHFDNKGEREFGLQHNPALAKSIATFTQAIKNNEAAVYISSVAEAFDGNHECIKFTKQLSCIKRNLDNISNRMGDSFIRAVGKEAEQQFAAAAYWLEHHRNTHWELTEKGNEEWAENALIRAEESRAQLLITGQLLDYCSAQGFKHDMWRASKSALGLRGWSLTRKILDDNNSAVRKLNEREQVKQQMARSINW